MAVNTTSLDEILNRYTTSGQSSGTILAAAFIVKNSKGETLYSSASGKLNSQEDSPPFTQDSVVWTASMSKLVTSVAAMQLVDRGLIGLDDDAGKHVPYLADVKVLAGFDDAGKPILEDRTEPITLRKLLTHTSGFAYETFTPQLIQRCESIGRTPSDDHTLDALTVPLIFQPGSSWMYGKSIDWAGRVIEAVAGCTLEEYMKRNIFEPLGMDSTTFFIAERPDLEPKRAEIDVHEVPDHPMPTSGPNDRDKPEIACGGSGLFGTANDYARLLGALVSQDSRILSPETLKIIYTPQLDDATVLQGFCETPVLSPVPDVVGAGYEHPIPVSHSPCGCVNLEDVPNHRKKGSLTWRGLTNGCWWIDPESGIAATMFVQVVPFGVKATVDLSSELETETYKLWCQK